MMNCELKMQHMTNCSKAKSSRQNGKHWLEIDVLSYQHYLDTSGLTDGQKDDFLRSLWTVIIAFVAIGYGVHPNQGANSEVSNLAAKLAARNSISPTERGAVDV